MIVQQLRDQGFKIGMICSKLNISVSQVNYIMANKDFSFEPKYYFKLNRFHVLWIKKILNEDNSNIGKRLEDIHKKFLEHFTLNDRSISKERFRVILKK